MSTTPDALVALLYPAVLDPAEWHAVLERLRIELNASAALQHVWRAVDKPDLSFWVNTDPAAMQRYQDHYYAMDPWMAKIHTIPEQTVAPGSRFLANKEFWKTEFYNEFLRPQDFHHFMSAVDETPPRGISVVSFLRSRNAPDFGRAEQNLLRALLPHFRNCVRIQRRLLAFQTRVQVLEETLDTIDHGILLLDPAGCIVHCNQSAEQILRTHSQLTVRQGRLHVRDHATHSRLSALLAAASGKTVSLVEQRPGAMLMRGENDKSEVRLLVAPFRARVHDDNQLVSMIVFLSTNRSKRIHQGELLRQTYGLTPTETRCALLLADGNSIADIALSITATRNTVRAHLRSLFHKTGTNRQGALVALVNREIAALQILVDGDRG